MITTALQFGGGKDSLACLHLVKDRLDDIVVVWMNTGAAFPETIAAIEEVKARVPHFHEVKSDVLADVAANGWPADIVPSRHAMFESKVKMRSWMDCCANNMWFPMLRAMREMEITRIIRGQRNTELYKSPVRDGDVIDGITYEFPIQDWTVEQVLQYLKDNNIALPAYYEHVKSSLDCWNCTAYLDYKGDQLAYSKKFHPDKYAIVHGRLKQMREEIAIPIEAIDKCLKNTGTSST